MGVRTTLFAVSTEDAARIAAGELCDFDVSQSCEIDKSGPGLWFFGGLESWASASTLDLGDAEFRAFSAEETAQLANSLRPEVITDALSKAERDVFVKNEIYPFNASQTADDVSSYLLEYSGRVAGFLKNAVKSNLSLIAVTT